jgi:hypothetical protein
MTMILPSAWVGYRQRAARPKALARALELRVSVTGLALLFVAAVVGIAGTIGPDARWLGALGRTIAHDGIPRGVPFAAAPSASWPNVPALAELVFSGLEGALGDRGLLLAQLVAVTFGLVVLSRDARSAGAGETGVAAALVVLVPAALLALVGIKAQLFSLALFPLLAALLRSEACRPSRRVWLLVPLLALWSNLHGAVLLGLAVALVCLGLHRLRRHPLESVLVGAAALLALCATPALERTPRYYLGVAGSEAAKRGYGLWAPLSPSSGFDLLLVAGAILLAVAFVRARPPAWELGAAVLLAGLTVHTARNGVWLLLFLAPRAATAVPARGRPRPAVALPVAFLLAGALVAGLVRGPLSIGARDTLIRKAISEARGSAILAESAPAEQIVAAGGRVWIANPLDAFRQDDQRAYIDWLQGKPSGDRLLERARVVVSSADSPSGRRLRGDHRFRLVARSGRYELFVRSPLG